MHASEKFRFNTFLLMVLTPDPDAGNIPISVEGIITMHVAPPPTCVVVSKRFYLPGLQEDVRAYITGCDQRSRTNDH